MLQYLPQIYPVTPTCLVFNEADRRGFVTSCREGIIEEIPDGVERLQHIISEEFQVTFMARSIQEKLPFMQFLFAPDFYRVQLLKFQTWEESLPGKAVTNMTDIYRSFGCGQLFNDMSDVRRRVEMRAECLKIGDKFLTVLQSVSVIDIDRQGITRITLQTGSQSLAYYLISGDNIGVLNDKVISLKKSLERTGQGYYEPKGDAAMRLMASAFPGNCYVKGLL